MLAVPLTLVSFAYGAVFTPTPIEARQLSVRSTYLSVVLLLVQAPSVRSIDSKIPRVTRLGANILMFWETDVTSGSIQQCSKPPQGRLERQAERCDPQLVHGPRQRKLLCADVLAFEAVGGPLVAHIRWMNNLARDMRGCFMRLWD